MTIVKEYSSNYFSHINIIINFLVEGVCVRADFFSKLICN